MKLLFLLDTEIIDKGILRNGQKQDNALSRV